MSQALAGVDAVIHSAGIAHAMSGVPEDDYRLLNTEATIRLAQAAQRAGARRFVFLSSIRAQCGPVEDEVQTESIEPKPIDAYGRSKLAAEQGLATLDIDWVALRPVLVYGPGVKGNMAELIRLARSRLPLPFGGLTARRSLLSLDNLVAGGRLRAVGAGAAAAAADRRRSRAFDAARDGRRHPPWPGPQAGAHSGAVGDAGGGMPRRRPRGSLSRGWRARWWPIRRRCGSSAGPRRSRHRTAWHR